MPGQIVISGATLTAGLRADFAETYKAKYKQVAARLGRIMQLGVPSDKLVELFAYYMSAPHPARWPRGENRRSKPFGSVQFSVQNFDWSSQVEWHENDRNDDQTKSLYTQAQDAGSNFAHLHERIFFQMLLAAADADLLPAIPTAPDGAALFATTAGGVARFGATNGNLLPGNGVGTGEVVRTDFWTTVQQFKLFQDTEGQPLWDDATLDGGYTVIYNAANEKIFREAFLQGRTIAPVKNVGGSENVGGAAVTNVILESGLEIILWGTQRITDNDWFVFLNNSPKKATFQLERQALRSIARTMENSDIARESKIESVMWDARYGYGVGLPYQTIKVNN
jgi:hypothetical protein